MPFQPENYFPRLKFLTFLQSSKRITRAGNKKVPEVPEYIGRKEGRKKNRTREECKINPFSILDN